jgi:uncharacterized membrane protein
MLNDFLGIAYAIVAAEAVYIAYRFFQTKDGLGRIALIATYSALFAYMVALMIAFIMRRLGATETELEVQRIVTRWLTMVFAIVMGAQVWVMRKRK